MPPFPLYISQHYTIIIGKMSVGKGANGSLSLLPPTNFFFDSRTHKKYEIIVVVKCTLVTS